VVAGGLKMHTSHHKYNSFNYRMSKTISEATLHR